MVVHGHPGRGLSHFARSRLEPAIVRLYDDVGEPNTLRSVVTQVGALVDATDVRSFDVVTVTVTRKRGVMRDGVTTSGSTDTTWHLVFI